MAGGNSEEKRAVGMENGGVEWGGGRKEWGRRKEWGGRKEQGGKREQWGGIREQWVYGRSGMEKVGV